MSGLNLRPENEELVSVTIIDQYNSPITEYQDEVNLVTLNLMLQAEFVTIREKTIKKKVTRVDEKGNVYFYGYVTEEDYI